MQPVSFIDHNREWEDDAACKQTNSDLFFAPGVPQEQRAKVVCRTCPVRWECLAYALRHRIEHGVWGGLTDRERRKILNRARPPAWDPDTAMKAVC